jgi:hypothetical protein
MFDVPLESAGLPPAWSPRYGQLQTAVPLAPQTEPVRPRKRQ